MYHTISEFEEDWKYEAEATLKIIHNLTDESLTVKLNKEIRTLGRLAWHIVTTLGEMVQQTELKFETVSDDSPIPPTAREIYDEYKRSSDGMLVTIAKEWTDDSLKEDVELYGQTWKKEKVISVLVRHQTHHRAQMTVLMRMAGLKVPGIYGPAKEEWAQMGMKPQE
jgi:uncharacterized damage-inducible protein DinB